MIEIEGESVFKEAKEWMLKNMTEEQEKDYSHRDSQPNSTQKRKHQITYLAFQVNFQHFILIQVLTKPFFRLKRGRRSLRTNGLITDSRKSKLKQNMASEYLLCVHSIYFN